MARPIFTTRSMNAIAAMLRDELESIDERRSVRSAIRATEVVKIMHLTHDLFAEANARFDPQRFFEACGFDPTTAAVEVNLAMLRFANGEHNERVETMGEDLY